MDLSFEGLKVAIHIVEVHDQPFASFKPTLVACDGNLAAEAADVFLPENGKYIGVVKSHRLMDRIDITRRKNGEMVAMGKQKRLELEEKIIRRHDLGPVLVLHDFLTSGKEAPREVPVIRNRLDQRQGFALNPAFLAVEPVILPGICHDRPVGKKFVVIDILAVRVAALRKALRYAVRFVGAVEEDAIEIENKLDIHIISEARTDLMGAITGSLADLAMVGVLHFEQGQFDFESVR